MAISASAETRLGSAEVVTLVFGLPFPPQAGACLLGSCFLSPLFHLLLGLLRSQGGSA